MSWFQQLYWVLGICVAVFDTASVLFKNIPLSLYLNFVKIPFFYFLSIISFLFRFPNLSHCYNYCKSCAVL